jgi:hypothetical protein
MYFWQIEKLKNNIKQGLLTERQRFIYALIYIVFAEFGMEVMTLIPFNEGGLSNVIIGFIGTFFCYRANKGANGTDFLGRYLAISVIISIRFFIYLISILIIIKVSLLLGFECPCQNEIKYIKFTLLLAWYLIMYWKIYVHIKQVNL